MDMQGTFCGKGGAILGQDMYPIRGTTLSPLLGFEVRLLARGHRGIERSFSLKILIIAGQVWSAGCIYRHL